MSITLEQAKESYEKYNTIFVIHDKKVLYMKKENKHASNTNQGDTIN